MPTDEPVSNKSSHEGPPRGNGLVVWWQWHRRLHNWFVHFADTKHDERAVCRNIC